MFFVVFKTSFLNFLQVFSRDLQAFFFFKKKSTLMDIVNHGFILQKAFQLFLNVSHWSAW